MSKKIFLQGLFFIVSFSVIFHLLFSFFGFNPTDDGFILALSRRIFEGQIPHKDFISIRPVLSPVLHIPEIIIGGDYTFWISRFVVWIQFALISWLWIRVTEKFLKKDFSSFDRFVFASVYFFFTVHTFPIMAWHTTDALMLYTLGLFFCISTRSSKKYIGYFLMGCSVLCRQNFILLVPITLFILSDWKKILNWSLFILPLLIYFIYLLSANALEDAIIQFNTQTDFFNFGIKRYYLSLPFLILGFFNGILLLEPSKNKLFNTVTGVLLFLLTIILFTSSILLKIYYYSTFAFFGFATGFIICLIGKKRLDKNQIKYVLIVFFYSLVSSFSVGYNYPAFGMGMLILFLILIFKELSLYNNLFLRFKTNFISILYYFVFYLLTIFLVTRYMNIYREAPILKIEYSVDDVIHGTRLIETNSNLNTISEDLLKIINKLERKEFTILPDFAAYWVKSEFLNPISLDWVQRTELNNPLLKARILHELNSLRKNKYIIIQKINMEEISKGIEELNINNYEEVKYVMENFSKQFETDYFIVYK